MIYPVIGPRILCALLIVFFCTGFVGAAEQSGDDQITPAETTPITTTVNATPETLNQSGSAIAPPPKEILPAAGLGNTSTEPAEEPDDTGISTESFDTKRQSYTCRLHADFIANPLTGTTPLTVHFTDKSTSVCTDTEVIAWDWDFGDGGISHLNSPSHVYKKAGSYDVKLTYRDSEHSDTYTRENYITVTAPDPTVTGIAPATGVNTMPIAITDLAGMNFITGATAMLTPMNVAPVHKGSISNGTGGALLFSPQDVVVSGNYAYVTSAGSNALEIVDVSDPANPVHKGRIKDESGGAWLYTPNNVVVSGNYAYVTSWGDNALEIVDVSNPANPVHKGRIKDGTSKAVLKGPIGIFVSGNYAFVASFYGNALEIVDISNPARPAHKGSITTGTGEALLDVPVSVVVSGKYAYVTSRDSNALEVVDVSDPANPVHKGSITDGTGGALLKRPAGVFVSGKYAYVTSIGSNALEVVDVSNPTNPVHKGSITDGTGGALLKEPMDVVISGNYAFVTSATRNALEVVDVSDPANPVHKGSISNGTGGALLKGPAGVFVSGKYAYVASTSSNALEVVDTGTIPATDVSVVSPAQITCTFDITNRVAGSYTVAVTNPDGSFAALPGGFTVTAPVPVEANVIPFGNTAQITRWPSHTDYSMVGGASAIRRDGSIETFIGGTDLSGTDWIQVTNNAALNRDGTIVIWTSPVGVRQNAVTETLGGTGKNYIAISQYNDWMLAIYEDSTGTNWLDVIGDTSACPAIRTDKPTGSGWIWVSAGPTHALALKSDGTLVAWGDNSYGQLDLSANQTYERVEAGDGFSIGITDSSSTQSGRLGHGGSIYAAGKDDYGQVSGMNNLPPGDYIAITAGSTRSAALTHDGTIVMAGEAWSGTLPPTGQDYTDIALGPDYGFVIKDAGPELTITGPLSPGQPVSCLEHDLLGAENLIIPYGSTIEHTNHEVTRIIRPDGSELGWANDREAEVLWTPWGDEAITTNVLIIPNSSHLNSTAKDIVTLKNAPSGRMDETQANILTLIYRYSKQTHTSAFHKSGDTSCTVPAPNWVEWATMSTSSIPNFYSFNTKWVIPNNPSNYAVGSIPSDGTQRTAVSTWNGIERTSGDGLIQAVPAWNWWYNADSENFDGKWSWAIWGKDSTHSLTWLTPPKAISAGDSFAATYWIDASTSTSTTWGYNAGKSGSLTTDYWTTSDLTQDNAEMEVAEEAYLFREKFSAKSTKQESQYFPSNTKFTNFIIQDTSGKTYTPSFSSCVADDWSKSISTLKVEVSTNPYAITLHTTS